ncbi:hypothetical protein BLA60_17490 [Actinophytocola xinjiangensis]|uniref:LppA-like lipoprotein n=1 Tax=Actinophytocola xinjiangensis TaxID=485602 RepID=A0A7Z0WMM0_9PSEU|nr:hypothetical protein [Actinophytocola xinjiangensis]OLF10229.1 hypothetical protein BLA60_17490 [Actinophytocola xinjiangensis]
MRRTALTVLTTALLVLTACAEPPAQPPAQPPAEQRAQPPEQSATAHHHEPQDGTGTPALGRAVTSMDELSAWVADTTGECADLAPATAADLADYLGPVRVRWYEPFVAEWATCGIAPYDRLGLVLFAPGRQRALQEFWAAGLAAGELTDNPDWAFGNGFAVTAGPLGVERLGLRYLWCEPVDDPGAHTVPADVEGCVYAAPDHH